MRTQARTIDEAPGRRTQMALITLFGGLVAALGATAAMMLGAGLG